MLRSTKNFRTIQSYKPNRQTSVADTDILIDNVHEIIQNTYAPIIRKKSQNAVLTDRVEVKYYQEMSVGRLCSCFKKEYDAPDAGCIVCFGVGRVGGFNLYGTYLDVIDTTRENLTMVNVKVNDEEGPWKFELVEGALKGFIEATINVPSMIGVDFIKLYSSGNSFRSTVRRFSDTAWHTLNRQIINSLAMIEQRLVIRIEMYRGNIEDASPSMTHLFIRYKLIDNTLYADMPRLQEFKNSDNFALTGLQTTQAFLSSNLPESQVNDIVKDLRRNIIWRVNDVNKNAPLGILTSWDIDLRSVESFEIYNQIP